MDKSLNKEDSIKYSKLWNKMHNEKPNWDIDDFYLNVDESDNPGLYKTMTEFEKLHNKAYHNVYG